MFDIKITTTKKKPSGGRKAPVVLLLFLIAGVLGILLFLKSLEGIGYQGWLVLPTAIVVCWAVWYSYFHRKMLFFLLFFLAACGCGLAVWRLPDMLREQSVHVLNVFVQEAELGSIQVTQLALLLAILLPFLIFILEFLLKNHEILYLLTTVLLFLPAFFGIQMKVEIIFLLVLFQLAFWTVHLTAGRSRKKRASGFSRLRLAGKSGAAVVLLFAAAFFAVLSFVMIFSEQLFDSVYKAEDYVYRSIRYLTGDEDAPVANGQVSQGNNYQTGAQRLKISSYNPPTEALYLRGFSGGDYIGGEWIPADDDAIFHKMSMEPGQTLTASAIRNFYSEMYFYLNSTDFVYYEGEGGVAVYTGDSSYVTVTIQHSNYNYKDEDMYENLYVPYYNDSTDWSGRESWTEKKYAYSYFEQKEMDYNLDELEETYRKGGGNFYYGKIQRSYKKQAQTTYTRVPRGLLPRLTELVHENPMTDLDEITAFILYTLHSNASYSRTPGLAPLNLNQDIVEYFLFERGEGFCEHFAAAATLMYRLYGIPARYATGYRVLPSDFELVENDYFEGYEASVTDASAHAWVEIFLDDYGWTPVEVTPSGDGSTGGSYPGFDSARLSQIWEEMGWDVSKPSLAKDVFRDPSAVKQRSNPNFLLNIKMDGEKSKAFLLPLLICLGCAVLLLPFFLVYRRRRVQRKMENWDCRAIFYRMIEALHFGGILSEYSGSELDFAKRLTEAVSNVSEDEAEKIASIVSKAAFSSTPPDSEEDKFARSVYHCVAASVYAELKWPKKIIFRFIKAFK